VLKYIDNISRSTGFFACTLILFMLIVILYEVVMRYVFNLSQIWAYETSQFTFATIVGLGGAYTLLTQAHVRMDIIYSRLSPKARAIMNIVTFVFFLIYIGMLIWKGWAVAFNSFTIGERTESVWRPLVWPVKMMIPLGAFLVLLQGCAFFVRNIFCALGKRDQ
jgi:TRAP-type mannitol/chloroaromatic compound transport system permease small subunit